MVIIDALRARSALGSAWRRLAVPDAPSLSRSTLSRGFARPAGPALEYAKDAASKQAATTWPANPHPLRASRPPRRRRRDRLVDHRARRRRPGLIAGGGRVTARGACAPAAGRDA